MPRSHQSRCWCIISNQFFVFRPPKNRVSARKTDLRVAQTFAGPEQPTAYVTDSVAIMTSGANVRTASKKEAVRHQNSHPACVCGKVVKDTHLFFSSSSLLAFFLNLGSSCCSRSLAASRSFRAVLSLAK